jgi:hypothetical protein
MSDSAPRKAAQADAQADAKQTDAKQAKPTASPAEADTAKTDTAKTDTAKASTAKAEAANASTAKAEPEAAAAATQAAAPDADGKPDMDEVKRKFREALDRKRETQADGTAGGGRNAGKIHGAHGSEDHRKTFRRKSG